VAIPGGSIIAKPYVRFFILVDVERGRPWLKFELVQSDIRAKESAFFVAE